MNYHYNGQGRLKEPGLNELISSGWRPLVKISYDKKGDLFRCGNLQIRQRTLLPYSPLYYKRGLAIGYMWCSKFPGGSLKPDNQWEIIHLKSGRLLTIASRLPSLKDCIILAESCRRLRDWTLPVSKLRIDDELKGQIEFRVRLLGGN